MRMRVGTSTSTYSIEEKNTLIMALNLEMSVSARAHAQLSSLKTSRHPLRYQLEDIIRTSLRTYKKLLLNKN